MRILFDQGTPVPLRRHLPEHRVDTAFERGWAQLRNSALLDRAEGDGYELLITTDQSLRHQQDLATREFVFLEYGAMDVVAAPFSPANTSEQGNPFVFADANGNGVDDGRETQANIYQAVLNTMETYPGVVNGLFFWDNWMTSDQLWSEWWADHLTFNIRGKPAEEVVRAIYESYRR